VAACGDGADEIGVGAFDGVTVLLVEDDPVSRAALELIFSYYGARVTSTESAEDALACYEQSSPSIVVSDIGLPHADGCNLLRAIRAHEWGRGRRTPAIAVSGFPSRDCRERVRQAGFDAFLHKPIDVRALLKTVRALAGTS
jgi:CheY-like chemotaxis protein